MFLKPRLTPYPLTVIILPQDKDRYAHSNHYESFHKYLCKKQLSPLYS